MDPEKDADSIDDLMKYIEIKSAANNIKITESVLGTAIKVINHFKSSIIFICLIIWHFYFKRQD